MEEDLVKYLGVKKDSKLNWKSRINVIAIDSTEQIPCSTK